MFKKLLITLVLFTGSLFAQTTVNTPTLQRNNTWTGSNNFNGPVTEQSVNGVIGAAGFADLPTAVAAVPAGGTLDVPPNTTYNLAAPISRASNIWVKCENRATSVIVAPPGGAVFSLSGTVNEFRIENCTIIANGAGSKVFDFTGVTASEGRISIRNNIISSFPNDYITFGASDYLIDFAYNKLVNNCGAITYAGVASDSWIGPDNFFENTCGSSPALHLVGPNVHVFGNHFIEANHTTGPDILLDPFDSTAANGGFVWIEDNKFGSDGGDSASRCKIQEFNPNTGFFSAPVVIQRNNFFGVTGQKLICINNPIRSWSILDNYIAGVGPTGAVVDDNFPVANASFGQSSIDAQRFDTTLAPTPLFTNGGKGFWRVANVENSAALPINHSQHESPELRNRLIAPSEDCSQASWVKSGVTCTLSIVDPLGTTRAWQLNAATNGNVSASLSNSAMIGHFSIRIWLQAGTLSQVRMGIKDNTVPAAFNQLPTFTLSPTWKEYTFDTYGVKAGDSFSFFILLDSAGTVNVAFPMVNDWGGDYIPTSTNAAVVDTTSGARFERNVLANSLNSIVQIGPLDNLQSKITNAGSNKRIVVAPGSTFTLISTLNITGLNNTSVEGYGATITCATGSSDCIQLGTGGAAGSDVNIMFSGFAIKPGSASGVGAVAIHANGATNAIRDINWLSNGTNRFTHLIQNDNDQALKIVSNRTDSGNPILQCDATFCGSALFGPGPNASNAGIFWVRDSNFSLACSGNGIDNSNGNDLHIESSIIQAFSQFGIRSSIVNGSDDQNLVANKVHIEAGTCTNPLFGIKSSAAYILQGTQAAIVGGQFGGNFPQFTVSGVTGTTVYHYWVVVNNGANHSAPLAAGYVTNGNATIDGTHTIGVVWNKITNATSYDILRQVFTAQPRTAPFGTGNFAVTTAFLQASCGTSTCSFTDNVTAPAGYTVATNSGYTPTIPMWPGDLVLSPSAENNIYTSGFASISLGKNAGGKIFICANGESSIVPCVSFVGINHQEFTTNNVPYSPTYDSAANVGLDPTHKPPAQLLMAETPFTGLAGTKGVVNYGGKAQQDAAGEIVTFYDDNFDKTFATASHRPTPDAGDGAICKDSTSGATMCDMAKTSWHSYINHVPTNGDTAWIEERTANLKQFKVIVNQINNKVQVASDFTVAANTSLQTITGLTWNIPATAINYSFRCSIDYSQATAAVSDAFGIQAATNAPTNIRASGIVYTAAGTSTSGTLSTLSTTTATNILTFTPSATATVFTAVLDGTIENPASANAVNIMVSTSNSADLITVKRGSYCQLF